LLSAAPPGEPPEHLIANTLARVRRA
jgi:hypothetical protein